MSLKMGQPIHYYRHNHYNLWHQKVLLNVYNCNKNNLSNQSLPFTSTFRRLIGANKHADEQVSGVTPVGWLLMTATAGGRRPW